MIFAMEGEANNRINFLDIAISKVGHKISFNVYRKHTATDIIITNDSCHQPERKPIAIRYLINRLSTLLMNETNKRKEYDTIKQVIHNTRNNYEENISNKITLIIDTQTQN